MKYKKKILARMIYLSGIVRMGRPLLSDRLIVFNYHRLRPDDPAFAPPFDEDVFGPTRSEFRRHMAWLKRNTRIISETDLLDFFGTGKFPGGINVMITFDDGYRDNYATAYPILKELGIPAIFFVPTRMIHNRKLGWWDIAAYLIKNTERNEIAVNGVSLPLRDGRRNHAIRVIQFRLQSMRPGRVQEFLAEMALHCRVPFPTIEQQGAQLMDWDEIRAVARDGFTIGSHTHSHATLSTLTPQEQAREMIRSGSILEEKTGKPVRSIAYPLGGNNHISADTARIAAETGYRAGFSFNTGFNPVGKIDPYHLRRIPGPDDFYLLFSSIFFPNLFYWKGLKEGAGEGA